jgi:hypothetical protein
LNVVNKNDWNKYKRLDRHETTKQRVQSTCPCPESIHDLCTCTVTGMWNFLIPSGEKCSKPSLISHKYLIIKKNRQTLWEYVWRLCWTDTTEEYHRFRKITCNNQKQNHSDNVNHIAATTQTNLKKRQKMEIPTLLARPECH